MFVGGWGAGGPAGAFGKDDDLPAACGLGSGPLRHRHDRLRRPAAVDRDHVGLPHVPAEHRDPHQLALDDEGRVGEQRDQRERLPQGLVLGGDDQRPLRDLLEPAPFDRDPARDFQEPQIGPRPRPDEDEQGMAGH